MRLHAEGDLMVAGARCTACGRWYAVAEGYVIPWCCYAPEGFPRSMTIEHRSAAVLDGPRPHPPADLEPLDFFEKGGK